MEALHFVAAQEPTAITQAWQVVLERQLGDQLMSEHQLAARDESSRTDRFRSERQLTAMDLSVLVVEDQPFQQQAINAILKVYSVQNPSVSFTTHCVENADEAIALLQTRRDFHIVILDVVLPGIHGDELLPMIRQLLGDYVLVVMVSAQGGVSLVQRCIFSGADSFMVKPLQIASVAQLWQQCMAKKRQLLSPASTPTHSFTSFKSGGTPTTPPPPHLSSHRSDSESGGGGAAGVPRRTSAPQRMAQPMAPAPPRAARVSVSAPTSPPAVTTGATVDPLEAAEAAEFGSALASHLQMHAATRHAAMSLAATRHNDASSSSGGAAGPPHGPPPRISSREGRLAEAGLQDVQWPPAPAASPAAAAAPTRDALGKTVRPPLRERPTSPPQPRAAARAPGACFCCAPAAGAAGAVPIPTAPTPKQLLADTSFGQRSVSPLDPRPDGCRQQ